jgi:hypothetical protein
MVGGEAVRVAIFCQSHHTPLSTAPHQVIEYLVQNPCGDEIGVSGHGLAGKRMGEAWSRNGRYGGRKKEKGRVRWKEMGAMR